MIKGLKHENKLRYLFEALSGALWIGLHLLCPWLHSWRVRWGTTAAEKDMQLPGDELISYRQWSYTHAISISAPAEKIWPWVVQIGQGRGGFYSYVALENLVGCRITNTEKIMPEHQDFKPGEGVRLHPQGPPLPVYKVEKNKHLLLFSEVDALTGSPPHSPTLPVKRLIRVTWLFYLLPQPDGSTRMITRGHYAYAKTMLNLLFMGRLILEPISFVMERKMLKEIKRLVERVV